jgi:hypothetical protein
VSATLAACIEREKGAGFYPKNAHEIRALFLVALVMNVKDLFKLLSWFSKGLKDHCGCGCNQKVPGHSSIEVKESLLEW